MVGVRKESATTVPPTGVLPPEVAELIGLQPEHAHKVNHIWGIMKDIKNDPYSAVCTGLAKFGDMACKFLKKFCFMQVEVYF